MASLSIRVQRLINIRISKAFRTTSSEALCIVAGLSPIVLKIEETATLYNIKKQKEFAGLHLDLPTPLATWPHPADFTPIKEVSSNEVYTTEVYTDGSRSENGVGSGVAIFRNHILIRTMKYRLHNRCSNNQAEQIAILKALETIPEGTNGKEQGAVAIYTDSQITIDSLNNSSNHNQLIESIRSKIRILKQNNWEIALSWIKAHAGHRGNELADQLAKQAANDNQIPVCYNRIPKSQVLKELQETTLNKWERQWQTTTKATVTKSFFPSVKDRLQFKISVTPNFTVFVTGHGRLRSYYHRFKIMDNPQCPCNAAMQTVDHIIYECIILAKERNSLKAKISIKGGKWPVSKSDMLMKYKKPFLDFVNNVNFELL